MNRLFVSDYLAYDFRAYRSRRPAIEAAHVVLYLFRNNFVTLTHEHVKHCLSAHYLTCGGDKRRKSKLLSNPGHFTEYSVILVKSILFL